MILSPILKHRYLDSNGSPLAGGKLYSYEAGTSTPLGTYSDQAGSANTNPIILDANGEADIWLDSANYSYKFVLKDSDDVTQWTVDVVTDALQTSTAMIAASAVTTAKINDAAVTTAKLATDAVTTVKITDANVTTAKLATDAVTTVKITDLNVTTAKLAALSVTAAKIAAGTITGTEMASNNILPGSGTSVASKVIVTSNGTGGTGLGVIRGRCGGSAETLQGENWSVIRDSLGVYSIAYGTAFADTASATVTPYAAAGTVFSWTITSQSTTGFQVTFKNSGGSVADAEFNFIAIGLRA